MSKNEVFGFACLIITTMMSGNAYARNASSIIPEKVRAIYPEPDKRIDCSPNSNPLGAQNICVVFTKDVTVNPECTGEAHIYRNGDTEPFQSVGISGVSVDCDKNNMGSVLFPYSCNENGSYRVTIPEGFWEIGDSSPTLSGAFDLYYEIYVPQIVTPTESVTRELSELRMEFPDYDAVSIKNPKKIEIFRLSTDERYPLSVKVGQKSDGSPDNYISIRLKDPITTQGDYNLFIQANAAEGIKYGDNYPTDPNDITIEPNTEAIYSYTVSSIPAPEIQPAPGIIESFGSFKLDIPDGADFWFANDKAVSFIYPIKDNGTLASDPICRLTSTRIEDSNSIQLTITDRDKTVEQLIPPAGKYALKLGNSLFSGSWNGEFINSAPFLYYYEVINSGDPGFVTPMPTDIEGIQQHGVYDLNGVRILNKVDSECIQNLPSGIYIINGQKVFLNQSK